MIFARRFLAEEAIIFDFAMIPLREGWLKNKLIIYSGKRLPKPPVWNP
jgi:hypothetical protein